MNKNLTEKHSIFRLAASSRIAVFILQLIFNVLPDHPAEAFSSEVGEPLNQIDTIVRGVFDGLVKWDSIYILHVSHHGYTTKPTFAFFPLFPFTVRLISFLLVQFLPFLSFYTCCMMSGVILNMFLFIGATLSLYDLTLNIFKSTKFAFITASLFCFNPASVFFSSCYTESMFCFFVFKGLSLIASRNSDKLKVQILSSLCFMLATSTRSNGFVNCGFIAYYFLQSITRKWSQFKINLLSLFCYLFRCFCLCVAIILPVVLVNAYGYFRFCSCPDTTQSLEDASCFARPEWCHDLFPSIYNHIQTHNWGLGLFAYYELRKIPNFLLASPLITLSFYSSIVYFNQRKRDLLHLGLLGDGERRNFRYEFATRGLFSFYFHLVFLVLFALLYMHVEVATRMVLSSSPVLYWTVASFILNDFQTKDIKVFSYNSWSTLSVKSKACVCYFLSYYILGVVLHCNFLPWT